MDLSVKIYQNAVFPLFDRVRGRRNIERLRFLRQSQHWPREKLERWQLDRLNELLAQAKAHSPFHRSRLEKIALPLRSLEEVQNLPILTKDEIRRNKDAIRNESLPASRFEGSRTGGSTGEPMHYFWDKSGMDWNRGSVYRAQEWTGTFLGERTGTMTGSHFDYTERDKLKWRIILWLQRYKDFPVAVTSDEIFERYFREMRRWRPTNLWGYSGGIYRFCRFVEKEHPGADLGFVRAVLTSSETLFPHQRETINRVFGGEKVFDQYGSREMYMASECREHSGYHQHAETVLTEIVDREGRWKKPGELGRVIVTDLFNHAFPFIRYEIGDVAVQGGGEPCPCGITLPKIRQVEGRISDVVVLEDRVLTAPNFTILFSDYEGLDAYQIVQKTRDAVEVNLVRNAKFDGKVENYITCGLRQMLGPSVGLKLNFVEKIAVPESGKRRFIISEVAKEQI